MDVEQLLQEAWTPTLAEQIADRVVQPGDRGYLIRAVQVDASEELQVMVWEDIADALAEQTGVDADDTHSGMADQAINHVWEILAARWQDGGTLAVIAQEDEEAATRAVRRLSMKAAEWAGCDVGQDPPAPLYAGGHLRLDTEGFEYYLETFQPYGISAEEHAAIQQLLALARPAPS